jgi:hypothetical protein
VISSRYVIFLLARVLLPPFAASGGHMGTVSQLSYSNAPKLSIESGSGSSSLITLRRHPLMSYRGMSNWPPAWTWVDGEEIGHVKGELGVLRDVQRSNLRPADRFLLIMEHDKDWYMGCLIFDNYFFCRQIVRLLEHYRGRSIEEIGGLDLSYAL